MKVWSYYADMKEGQLGNLAFFSFDKDDLSVDPDGDCFIASRKIMKVVCLLGNWEPPKGYGVDFDPNPLLSPSLPKCKRAVVKDVLTTWK